MEKKRILIFISITFLFSWGTALFIFLRGITISDPLFAVVVMCIMLVPAISTVVTRIITKEGFVNLHIKPNLKENGKIYALAWVLPVLFIIAGAAIYFLFFPSSFTLHIAESAAGGMFPQELLQDPSFLALSATYTHIVMACFGALLIGPIINFIPSFGEEFGWRGYLLPKLLLLMSPTKASIVSGIVWGVWHAPLIVLGLKYGFGYPLAPYSGVIAMIILCIFLGSFMNFTFLKTKSIIPATIIHGSFNALCELPGMLVFAGANPLVGPKPIGIIGGIGILFAGVISLMYMKKLTSKRCALSLLDKTKKEY